MFNKAIVIGGTGATGRHLVKKLLINNNFKKITTIGRRPILNGKKHSKIDDIVVLKLVQALQNLVAQLPYE